MVGDEVAGGNLWGFWNHSRETDSSEGISQDTLAERLSTGFEKSAGLTAYTQARASRADQMQAVDNAQG